MQQPTDGATIDFRLVCRTCLSSDAEFYKLEAPIFSDNDEDDVKLSFADCLRYCTAAARPDDETASSQFPIYICIECSAALQVAYNFIRNAIAAQEILRQKLCAAQTPPQRRNGGLQKLSRAEGAASKRSVVDVNTGGEEGGGGGDEGSDDVIVVGLEEQRPMRYRCKICGEKVETKRSLKEHVKLHLDLISYCCQLCNFESKKRSLLSDHYSITHGLQPTREQLKPRTSTETTHNAASSVAEIKSELQQYQQDEVYTQMEQLHNPKATPSVVQYPPPPPLPAAEPPQRSYYVPQQQPQQLFQQQLVQQIQEEREQRLKAEQREEQKIFEQQLQIEQEHLEQRQLRQQQQQQQQLLQQQLELANVITTTVDAEQSIGEAAAMPGGALATDFNDFGSEFNMANEMSVGNEFIVMADGTVEEVMGNGVVIEYINAAADGVTLENGLVLDDLVQVEQSNDCGMMNMNVDDIIIEENVLTTEVVADTIKAAPQPLTRTLPLPPPQPLPTAATTSTVPAYNAKKIKCKICALFFVSQEKLKTHMLNHNEIPHFFCDQCPFYTFYKIDLTQHYKTKHKLEPTSKQLQPKNKVKQSEENKPFYTCDLCLFETNIKFSLRKHYMNKHQVEATDVQLRPAIENNIIDTPGASQLGMRNFKSVRVIRPDYPNGLQCKKCSKVFYWRNKLKEHYKRHNLEENAAEALKLATLATTPSPPSSTLANSLQLPMVTVATTTPAPAPTLAPLPAAAAISPSDMDIDTTITVAHNTHGNTHGYSGGVPLDAIPQVVETDVTIDNELDFDFNGDGLFEDFEEDDENVDNDDDNEDFQDLLLTSEDDFEDLLEEQSNDSLNSHTQRPFCMHCNKKFFSQYQFENHMFVHRGLAPYRCEMCTNLYNTKRALIRHYKAVHKKVPTRDMIQAKGDKVAVDRTTVEHLNLEEQKAVTLMCAKCPFESTELQNLQIHLNTIHGVADENYMLQKLPFECPRCIRSYATKSRLIRHLERSHSVATIIQQRQQQQPQLQQQQQPPPAPNINNDYSSRCAAAAGDVVRQKHEESEEEEIEVGDVEDFILIPTEMNTINKTTATPEATDATPTPSAAAAATAENAFKEAPSSSSSPPAAPAATTNATSAPAAPPAARAPTPPLPPAAPQYKCQSCHDFSCDTLEALDEHSKLQHADDDQRERFNFKCDICDGKYKSHLLLKHHLKRHNARKYRCLQCPKTYINRSELEMHKLSHLGIMPHKCDMCEKQFRYAHHLKRHRDVAHFGKRVCCPVPECGREFTTLAQLNIHSWNHNGKTPYKCKYCGTFFKKRELLRQHARKVHNVNLTEAEIAEIYRNTVGYTNPHDFTVTVSNGKMLRRNDVEAVSCETGGGVVVEQINTVAVVAAEVAVD